MCGIFGVLSHTDDSFQDCERLRQTARLLAHRGPDATGVFAGPGVGLVHTRLSLLDLNARSNQPLWDAERRFALVYNGEIYNFKELRTALEKDRVRFDTTSDTEVLLQALRCWGPGATLRRLEGMFAFGLFDRKEQTLLLARDRFGIKPLFMRDTASTFLFASEIAAMTPWMAVEPDLLSISSFLHGYAGPHRGHTFFRDVKYVDPGCVVRVKRGCRPQVSSYFSLGDLVDPEQRESLRRNSDAQRIDALDKGLHDIVKSQLVADAPVGALCSGGLDSSLVVAIASRHHSNISIFHADVKGPLSELEAASALARHLKLELKTVPVKDEDFVAKIPQAVKHYGQPFYPNPHAIPFLMVSEVVNANGVKAVLTGEGADECYLGYPWLVPKARGWAAAARVALRGIVERATLPPEPECERYWGPTWQAAVPPFNFARNQAALVTAMLNRFEVVDEARETRERLWRSGQLNLGGLKSIDLLQYNLRTLLHRNDAMGMAASLEARFPFLDSGFVRTAINMPDTAKVRFSLSYRNPRHDHYEDKWLLRRVAARYLPRSLSHRPKLGFPVNAAERMVVDASFFRGSCVQALFGLSARGVNMLADEATQPLTTRLIQLEVWASLFLGHHSVESVTDRLTTTVRVRGN